MTAKTLTKAQREAILDWRAVLTAEEAAIIETADAAKREWRRLNAERAYIVNRAIQRAKYRAGRAALSKSPDEGAGR